MVGATVRQRAFRQILADPRSYRGQISRMTAINGAKGARSHSTSDTSAIKNVVVLGGSYAGAHASQVLSRWLPRTHRVILIERNSHMNHLYVIPRYSITSGHEHKGFIPYNDLFKQSPPDSGLVVRGTVESIDQDQVKVRVKGPASAIGGKDLSSSFSDLIVDSNEGKAIDEKRTRIQENKDIAEEISSAKFETIPYDYMVYALGASLPKPLENLVGEKRSDVIWLKSHQNHVKTANQILIIGGGALGVQFAADIKEVYREKRVVLVHSRARLMNQFDSKVGDEAKTCLEKLGVEIILNDRVSLSESRAGPIEARGEGNVRRQWMTQSGRTFESDYEIFCTGQKYNTHLLSQVVPECVKGSGAISVNPYLQIIEHAPAQAGDQSNVKWQGRIFAIGDVADTGSIKAGHTGWGQGEVAARNIVRLIEKRRRNKVDDGSIAPGSFLNGHSASHSPAPGDDKIPLDIFPENHEQTNDIEAEEELAAEMAWKKDLNLEAYVPPPPMLKLTIGLKTAITQSYQEESDGTKTPTVTVTHDGIEDLNAAYMWGAYGASTEDLHA